MNVQLLSLEDSRDPTWLEQIKQTRVTFFASQPPRLISVTPVFLDEHPDLDAADVDPHLWVSYRDDGRVMGTRAETALALLERARFIARHEDYRPELACFDIVANIRVDERIYNVSPMGNDIDVAGFDVVADIDVEVGPVELTPAQYGDASIVHGVGKSESFGVEIRGVQTSECVPGEPFTADIEITLPQHVTDRKPLVYQLPQRAEKPRS